MRNVVLLTCLALVSCNGGSVDIVSPEPIDVTGLPPLTTTTTPSPIFAAPFSWDPFYGFTAFALGYDDVPALGITAQTEMDVILLFGEALMNGWNTARICSETEFWDFHLPWLIPKARDIERLKWLLDVIAGIDGAQVLLIGDCTLKGPVTEENGRKWASKVARLAAKYDNVAVETHNEFRSCPGRGWGPHCPTKGDVRTHVGIYRAAGVEFVTVDEGVCKDDLNKGTLGFSLFETGAWPADFHPCREWPFASGKPWDPNVRFLRELVKVNGMVLLSETVALSDLENRCSGTRTCDQDRIQRLVNNCAQVDAEFNGEGCKVVYHTEKLLGGMPPNWWPTIPTLAELALIFRR